MLRMWFNFFTTLMQLATPILLALSTAVTVYFSKRAAEKTQEVADSAKAAAAISSARKDVTDQKLAMLQNVADTTHTLVNGQHGVALETILEQAKRLSDLTKTPRDAAAVVAAQESLDAHNAKTGQIADAKGKP
jgi:hypothetical protein